MSNAEGSDILEVVRQIIAKQLTKDVSLIKDTSVLTELGVDSLDVVEIIFALEEKFDVDIPFNANESDSMKMETVGQIADEVRKIVDAKA